MFFSIFPADVEGFTEKIDKTRLGTFNYAQFGSLCGSCVVLNLWNIGGKRARKESVELTELVPEEIRNLMARSNMVVYGSAIAKDHFREKGIEVKWMVDSQDIYKSQEENICRSLGNDGDNPRTSIDQITFVSELINYLKTIH